MVNHTKTIKSKFKQLHQSLDKREAILIETLNKIAKEKKAKLGTAANTLKQQQVEAQQVMVSII